MKSRTPFEPVKDKDVFLSHARLERISYSGLHKVRFEALGCQFIRCDFTRMKPREMTFASGKEPTVYSECSFNGSKFHKVILGQSRFENCAFLDVDIEGMLAHAAEFVNCVFSGLLRGSVFYGRVTEMYRADTVRTRNEISGNDFSKATFIDVGFREGVDLSLQKLPEGSGYLRLSDAETKLAKLRHKYLSQPASDFRQEIFNFLSIPERNVRGGQKDLFFDKETVAINPKFKELIWAELKQLQN